MKISVRLKNAISVRFAKLLSTRIPLRLIWLQDTVIFDVLGALLNKKLIGVDLELAFPTEKIQYENSITLSMYKIRELHYPEVYLVSVSDAYLSPLSGLCWREKQYFTQSVGHLTACFGYRTAFRQTNYYVRKGRIVDIGVVVVNTRNISHFLLEDLPVLIKIARRGIPATIIIRSGALPGIMEIINQYFKDKLKLLITDDVVLARKAYFLTRSEEPPLFRRQYADLLRSFILPTSTPNILDNQTEKICRIYISRTRSKIRAIENEHDLESCLAERGFHILYLEELSFSDQVDAIKNATVIVGLHGAGLTNILWAKSNCLVIEVFPIGYFNSVFELLSCSLGFTYTSVFCEQSYSNKFGRIDIDKVKKLIPTV